jgi:broad specificity phosphatase PhoE
MADESDKERLVRVDFPRGLDAASIAKAIREQGRRILDEVAAEKAKQEKPVRFDFPTGESADAIAKALTEARKRIMAEHAAKQQPKKD